MFKNFLEKKEEFKEIRIRIYDLLIKLTFVFTFCFLLFFGMEKIIPGKIYAIFPVDWFLLGTFLMSFLIIKEKNEKIEKSFNFQKESPVFFGIMKVVFIFLSLFLVGVYFLKFWQNKAEKLFLIYFPLLAIFIFLIYYLWKEEGGQKQ